MLSLNLKLKRLTNLNPKYVYLLQFTLVQSASPVSVLDFSAYLKACYCEGPGTFLQDLFWKDLEQFLSTLKLPKFIGAFNQTLLYLQYFVETFCLVNSVFLQKIIWCPSYGFPGKTFSLLILV